MYFGLVAARVAPGRQRVGVAELGGLVVALHQDQFRGLHRGGGLPDARWGDRQQQFVHGGGVADAADELTHHAEPAAVRDGALLRGEVTSDQPQQCRLARAVRADECRRDAVADPERHVVEQHPAIGKRMADMTDLDMAHAGQSRTP